MHAPLRHYCRNPRCRSRLTTPVENKHHAFCTPGCHTLFYRRRCLICERKLGTTRLLCSDRKCRSEYRQFPQNYRREAMPYRGRSANLKSAGKMGSFWRDRSGQGWIWEPDSDGHRLLNRKGEETGRLDRDGDGYIITSPRAIPPAPATDLEKAKRHAVSIALAALDAGNSVRVRKPSATAILGPTDTPINLIGGFPFRSAPHLELTLRRAVLAAEGNLIANAEAAP